MFLDGDVDGVDGVEDCRVYGRDFDVFVVFKKEDV